MANSYLTRTPSSTGNRRKFTFSTWIKRSKLLDNYPIMFKQVTNSTNFTQFYIDNADRLVFYVENSSGSGTTSLQATNRLFRDTSAWYHVMVSVDTDQSSAGDRVKIYVNGVQETSFSTNTQINQNTDLSALNTTDPFGIGYSSSNNSQHWNGYMSHVAFVDGQQLAPTVFGETDSTSGIWKFKSPSGVTWGTNGFHLKFENSAALGTDSSGNTNTFTVNGNLKQAVDTPSNVYATLNSLVTSSYNDLTQGNNTVKGNTGTNDGETYSTLGTGNKGKWYWEIKATGINGAGNPKLGFVQTNSTNIFRLQNGGSGYGGGSNSDSIMIRPDGAVINEGSTSGVLYGTFSAGDILSFALDSDNGAFYYAINGTWQNSGDPTSGASKTGAVKTWTATSDKASQGQHVCIGTYDTATQADCNFGNGFFGTTAITSAGSNGNGSLFEYDCPSGYYALNTKNINTYG